MRKITKKLLSVVMSVALITTICPSLNIAEVKAEDNPVVLRFLVASDAHMAKTDDYSTKRFIQMFKSAYAYAEKQSYKKIDAAILVGDIVDRGRASEYTALKQTLSTCNVKDETQVYMTMGNHEWWAYTNDGETSTGKKTFLAGMEDIPELDNVSTDSYDATEFSVNINGYQFIGMSPENYNDGRGHDVYGTEKYAWMKNEIAKAKKADSTKAIFTFQHHPVNDTVYGSDMSLNLVTGADEQKALDGCYNDSQQVINFSGHSHSPVNTPTAINQTTYTQYTTGSMYSIWLDDSAGPNRQPEKATQIGQYSIVEVTADGNVQIKPYDILSDKFFETLSATDPEGTQLIYDVNVNDTSSWKYTSEKREKNAPYFEEDDKVTYKAGKITIDQAKDDTGVYAYEMEVSTDDKTKNRKVFSDWYYSEMPAQVTYTLDMLEYNKDYTLKVYPVDFFENKGEPITIKFKADDIVEKVETPDVYNKEHFTHGTFENALSYWGAGTLVGKATVSTTQAHTGTYSGMLTTKSDMLLANVYTLEADKKYEVSMWMYVPLDAPSNAKYQLGVMMTKQSDWGGDKYAAYWNAISKFERGEWFQYKFQFEYPEGCDIAQFVISSEVKDAVVFVDDISVKRYHDCKAEDFEGYAPTYDNEGMKPGKRCPLCEKIYEGCETIPMLERPTTERPTTAKPTVKPTTKPSTKNLKAKIKKIDTKKLKSKKLSVKLVKISKAKKYEIQVSTSSKFKKVLLKKTIKKTSYTFNSSKLKNKKKLYVRAKVQGSKYWTKAKKVTVKK